jgi:hypothetical protein
MDAAPLANAVITALMLLEHSDDSEIDPDIAVRGLENIAHELLKLQGEDRVEFLALLERIAAQERNQVTAEFVRAVPFKIGMVE